MATGILIVNAAMTIAIIYVSLVLKGASSDIKGAITVCSIIIWGIIFMVSSLIQRGRRLKNGSFWSQTGLSIFYIVMFFLLIGASTPICELIVQNWREQNSSFDGDTRYFYSELSGMGYSYTPWYNGAILGAFTSPIWIFLTITASGIWSVLRRI